MLKNPIEVYFFMKSIFWHNNRTLVDYITRISISVAYFFRNTTEFASSIYIHKDT